MRKVVIGLSGGMDSATLLGQLLEQGAEVHCCMFSYGSKHSQYERASALKLINFYKERHLPVFEHHYDLIALFQAGSSALLKTGGDIPEGHYNDENMKATVVPGRNLIFSSIMASLAESIEAESIALGVHSGDHHIYPDCRPAFIGALNETIFESTDGMINIITPLLRDTKETILRKGLDFIIPVPYELTRTCYKDQPVACGKCGSCIERLEAFQLVGIPDPVPYSTS